MYEPGLSSDPDLGQPVSAGVLDAVSQCANHIVQALAAKNHRLRSLSLGKAAKNSSMRVFGNLTSSNVVFVRVQAFG